MTRPETKLIFSNQTHHTLYVVLVLQEGNQSFVPPFTAKRLTMNYITLILKEEHATGANSHMLDKRRGKY